MQIRTLLTEMACNTKRLVSWNAAFAFCLDQSILLDFVFPAPVISPPKIVQGPQRDMEVVAGHTLTLECVVEGSPVPHVTWDKYGGVLPNGRFVQELGKCIE